LLLSSLQRRNFFPSKRDRHKRQVSASGTRRYRKFHLRWSPQSVCFYPLFRLEAASPSKRDRRKRQVSSSGARRRRHFTYGGALGSVFQQPIWGLKQRPARFSATSQERHASFGAADGNTSPRWPADLHHSGTRSAPPALRLPPGNRRGAGQLAD